MRFARAMCAPVEAPARVALVIESSAARRRDLDEHLDAIGFLVVHSATLEEAQLVASSRRVALHVLAIDAPDERARVACARLKALNKTAMFIFISGAPEVAVIASGICGVTMPPATEGRHVRAQVQILTKRRRRPLDTVAREHIDRVVDDMDGNRTRAAKLLRVDRATLRRKLDRR